MVESQDSQLKFHPASIKLDQFYVLEIITIDILILFG